MDAFSIRYLGLSGFTMSATVKQIKEESVRNLWKGGLAVLAAMAIGGVTATGALAQTVRAWTPKPIELAPYVKGNKPHTKLSEVLANKDPFKTWRHKVVDDKHLKADYVGLKVGDSTRTRLVADHRTAFIVWDGQIEVTIQGQTPFVATKGFMVQVPFRLAFTLKNVGSTPSLHFEIFNADSTVLYPENSATLPKPPKVNGSDQGWYLSRLDAPDTYERQGTPVFYDFLASPAAGAFVSDDRMFVNRIRGQARNCDPQPATSIGHFHVDYAEFWFIMEGQISYNIEGLPFFVSEPGDIVYVPAGRWHSAANHCPGFDTRIAINGYPRGSHHWPVTQPAVPPIDGPPQHAQAPDLN
jgi:mannose-6-phosphate isomerase-like protein (cupin superfamily)